MASETNGFRRRLDKPQSKSVGQEANSGYESLHAVGDRDRSDSRRGDTRQDGPSSRSTRPESRAEGPARSLRVASPMASVTSMHTTGSSTGHADFATGADFIAFDFSDGEELQDDFSFHYSPNKGKGKEREIVDGRDRRNDLKRTAKQMESNHHYAGKKQDMDAGLRLTPWVEDLDWDSCRNLAEMMHKEVEAFVNYMSPSPEEHEVRRMIVATIARAIRSAWPDAEVLPFGSFETKLYLPLGDIDLVILSRIADQYAKRQVLYNLAQILRRADITSKVTVIANARVPIVKFVTNLGRFAVDISLNHDQGIVVGRIVNRFLNEFPALRSLVMVIKLFLSQRSMNEVYTGGLGSYALVCMAVSFLQMHPKIRSGEIDPSENLGVLVMEFFELYGHYFNYENAGISIRDGGTYFNKKDRGWLDQRRTSLLSIEDPNDISNDISKNSYNITQVRKTLAGAHEILATTALIRSRILMSKAQGRYTRLRPPDSRDREYDNPSILGSVLCVTQETLNHRRMVRRLYENSTLQNLLGLAYRPTAAVAVTDRAATVHHATSKRPRASRWAIGVESARGKTDMDVSSNEEPSLQREQSPESEDSRYSTRNSRKRRKLNSHGERSKLQDAIFVSGSDEEVTFVSQVAGRSVSEDPEKSTTSSTRSARNGRRRAYWASKGLSGGGLDDSD